MEALSNCHTYELKGKKLTSSDIASIPLNTTHLRLDECTIASELFSRVLVRASNYNRLANTITNLPNLRQLTVQNCPNPNILGSFSKL